MIKLNYPVQNRRWGSNDLNFRNWSEYWKTLGYLSNPNVHRYNNNDAVINLSYEQNSLTNSYSDTMRIYYYGSEEFFEREFPDLFAIRKSNVGSETFRINRKEFGETLICDLGFYRVVEEGHTNPIFIPPNNENDILNRISNHPNFDYDSWSGGYNLGND